MTGYDSSDDQRPLTYFNGHPIYTTTLLVIVHVLTMIVTALAGPLHIASILQTLAFSSAEVFSKGWAWQYFTYAFLNQPSIWFAVEMLLLFRFGRDVEQFLGRRSFLRMYLLLLLLTPAALSLIGAFLPTAYVGSGALHFAVFVAFAAIYPDVPIFFGVSARWVAAILLGIYTLQLGFALHSISMLTALWVSSLGAMLYIWHERGVFAFPTLNLRRRKFHIVREEHFANESEDAVESIDPLLEKISRSGLASLTRKERAELEKAREALMKKESHR